MTNDYPKIIPLIVPISDKSFLIHNNCEVKFNLGSEAFSCIGEVTIELFQTPKIIIKGYIQNTSSSLGLNIFLKDSVPTCITLNQCEIDSFFFIDHKFDSAESLITLHPKREPINCIGNNETEFTKVVFHLFNFVEFFGDKRWFEPCGVQQIGVNFIELVSEYWKVGLKSLTSSNDDFNKLKAEGGYKITHVGIIEKIDSSLIKGIEANDILIALRYFFTFVKGNMCGPVCAIGINSNNDRTWESWSSPNSIWKEPFSWFNGRYRGQLAAFFPLFMKKWKDENWRKTFKEIIYWYHIANDPSKGIEAGIILTQAAIERLSYEYLVYYQKLLKPKQFKDKNCYASEKFRQLFINLGIPVEVPQESPKIIKLSQDFSWQDAPHALTVIRNSLVHPNHALADKVDACFFEAWNLSLWYLEMSILAICEYNEPYCNRLKHNRWRGEVEKVPWQKPI